MSKSTIPKQTRLARVFFRPNFGAFHMEKSNKKAAGLLTQAAYQKTHGNHTKSVVKKIIISLACRGFIPISFADWIVQRGGLRDA